MAVSSRRVMIAGRAASLMTCRFTWDTQPALSTRQLTIATSDPDRPSTHKEYPLKGTVPDQRGRQMK